METVGVMERRDERALSCGREDDGRNMDGVMKEWQGLKGVDRLSYVMGPQST